jgi:hypothetical protein
MALPFYLFHLIMIYFKVVTFQGLVGARGNTGGRAGELKNMGYAEPRRRFQDDLKN